MLLYFTYKLIHFYCRFITFADYHQYFCENKFVCDFLTMNTDILAKLKALVPVFPFFTLAFIIEWGSFYRLFLIFSVCKFNNVDTYFLRKLFEKGFIIVIIVQKVLYLKYHNVHSKMFPSILMTGLLF